MAQDTIAILGGTGDQGLGLALRFAKAGRRVVIGSRKSERAVEAAEQVRKQVAQAQVEGLENADAVIGAPIVILSGPF
jgi:predicted dinucleotide-binding enzyme